MNSESRERITRDVHRLGQALERLDTALAEPEASSKSWLDTAQAYEYAMDLFWKLSKEMLAARGIETHMPREAVREAHQRGWIDDPSVWIEMLKDEYELSGGNYDHSIVQRLYPRIRTYFPVLCQAHARMVVHLEEL